MKPVKLVSSVLAFAVTAVVIIFLYTHCGSEVTVSEDGTLITFTPVGSAFGDVDLIDLEFLPDQNGEAIVIGKGGTVYYMTRDFAPLAATVSISVNDGGEQGLLNVAADPDYATNGLIYLYLTAPDGGQNQVDRLTVTVDVNAGTFTLTDRQTVIAFPKSDSPNPGSNHNGGGLLFNADGEMIIAVGDGGGSGSTDLDAELGQDPSTRLGKLLRILPIKTAGTGGFEIPAGGNNGPTDSEPEIYTLGLRNPFSITARGNVIFVGDVGAGTFEEINLVDTAGLNFGWPHAEGDSNDVQFQNPIHGYAHSEANIFIEADPESTASPSGSKSIMVGAFYEGPQYNGVLSNRLIYAEFFAGWVRGLELDANNDVIGDRHLGHLNGMSSLQQGPDGNLYAVSLFASDRILRVELAE